MHYATAAQAAIRLCARRGGVVLTVAALAAVCLALFPTSGKAAGLCSGNTYNYFDGAETSGTVYGVQVQIAVKNPQLCSNGGVTSANEFSSAWAMITGGAINVDGWAQAGYGNFHAVTTDAGTNTGFLNFSQWTRCFTCGTNTKYFNAPASGNQYITVYNTVDHALQMEDAPQGDIGDETNFDPYAGVWSTPIQAQLMAETSECTNNTIGTQASAAGFSQIQTEPSIGTWGPPADLSLIKTSCTNYYSKWGQQPSLFYVWTQ